MTGTMHASQQYIDEGFPLGFERVEGSTGKVDEVTVDGENRKSRKTAIHWYDICKNFNDERAEGKTS